jgi:hypothetical protein
MLHESIKEKDRNDKVHESTITVTENEPDDFAGADVLVLGLFLFGRFPIEVGDPIVNSYSE